MRQAEAAVEALQEACDALRADEGDLRGRLAGLHAAVAAAERERADIDAARAAASQVR